jgi:hypothetical protein
LKRRQKRVKDPDALSLLLEILSTLVNVASPILKARSEAKHDKKWVKGQSVVFKTDMGRYLTKLRGVHAIIERDARKESESLLPGSMNIDSDRNEYSRLYEQIEWAHKGIILQLEIFTTLLAHSYHSRTYELIERQKVLEDMFTRLLQGKKTIQEFSKGIKEILDYCDDFIRDLPETI